MTKFDFVCSALIHSGRLDELISLPKETAESQMEQFAENVGKVYDMIPQSSDEEA